MDRHWCRFSSRLQYTVRLFRRVLPMVDAELAAWRQQADLIPDPSLREQALNSLHFKRFHCEGGSVFASQFAQPDPGLVRAIVALQTLSDYLDNLVDRWAPGDGTAARRLHQAFLDAVEPTAPPTSYFTPTGTDDGGYARALVDTVRKECLARPGYGAAAADIGRLARLYADLQVLKHLPVGQRRSALQSWVDDWGRPWREQLHWWELAAAAGSTLGIFALLARARQAPKTDHENAPYVDAYFPWIGALHILLDYFIDQEEDRLGGDFNFAACYDNAATALDRLHFLFRTAHAKARSLPDGQFHGLVVQGLPGLYLADEKVRRQGLDREAQALLAAGGGAARLVFLISRRRRRRQGEGLLLQPPPRPGVRSEESPRSESRAK